MTEHRQENLGARLAIPRFARAPRSGRLLRFLQPIPRLRFGIVGNAKAPSFEGALPAHVVAMSAFLNGSAVKDIEAVRLQKGLLGLRQSDGVSAS